MNGMYVMIHRREDMPNFLYARSNVLKLESDKMEGHRIHLVPQVKEVDTDLRSFPVAVRQCKFQEESDSRDGNFRVVVIVKSCVNMQAGS